MTRDPAGVRLTMRLKSLSSLQVTPTAGGTTGEWLTTFTTYDPGHPGNGVIYYAGMQSVLGGAPTFFVGQPVAAGLPAGLQVTDAFSTATPVPGSYDPASGVITIHIPFADLGTHGPKTKLYSVTSFTATTSGSLAGNPDGIFNVTDSTTPYDYVVPSLLPGASSHPGGSPVGSGTRSGSPSGGTLALTGGLGAPLLALLVLILALLARALLGLGHRRSRPWGRF